ncbi:oxidoreductase [Acrocarpospora phusangensis]|uniref:Oxidoreductase n=1 Tax=Acrocarpospora phusangensis TaxID=1070424 RepID=A0A919UIK1_9ACTN|nr:SDR family NAD(P)-dependent oxidoreductase [Acrocarpospora phusangensis]GIH22771.1 oxidoreductase [Acrocarpospora phusangensis]
MNPHAAALITGAGGALGRATALRLSADGRPVAILDVDEDNLAETARLIEETGGAALPLIVDLRDAQAIADAIQRTIDRFGPLGVLVNNAAIYPSRPFLDVPIAEYDDVHAVNQRAYWIAAQCAARRMAATGGGAIVNLASITMHGGWSDLAAYVATKGAITSMTRALARELGPMEIRVNCVSPGAFPTAAETIHPDPDAYNRSVLASQALKRRGKPAELAAVISFLTGPDSTFVTGQCLEVNGGWVMA